MPKFTVNTSPNQFWRAVRDFRPDTRAFPLLMELMCLVMLGAFLGGMAHSQPPNRLDSTWATTLEKQVALTTYQVEELKKTVSKQQDTIDKQNTEMARIEGIGLAIGGSLTVLQLLRLISERKPSV